MIADLTKLTDATNRGVDFLYEHQLPNGEFCCYYSPDDPMKVWCVPDSTVFMTVNVANSLLDIPKNKKAASIFENVIGFLQYQKMRGGGYNYFTKSNPLFRVSPADIDDTAAVATLFRRLGVSHPDCSHLMLANRSRKGLFYTWYTFRGAFSLPVNKDFLLLGLRGYKHPLRELLFWFRYDCSRFDVDAVVNANVLFFLGINDQTIAAANYIKKIILTSKESTSDRWYHNRFVQYYFFSRLYDKNAVFFEDIRKPLSDRVISAVQKEGLDNLSALECALTLSSFIHLNVNIPELNKLVQLILGKQNENGSWDRWVYFYSGFKKKVGWGSEELTTGFCVEAIEKYRKWIANEYEGH